MLSCAAPDVWIASPEKILNESGPRRIFTARGFFIFSSWSTDADNQHCRRPNNRIAPPAAGNASESPDADE
jgi:hypothetical protein